MIASRLLDEIGVLNSKPVVTVLPDDPSLGEFRSIFRNMLGTIEETPTGEKDGRPGFAGADKIVDTYELYELLEKDNDNQVDAKEYLKARLFDILVGDWDRHYDQWLWAGYRKDGKTVYKPVPVTGTRHFRFMTDYCRWLQEGLSLRSKATVRIILPCMTSHSAGDTLTGNFFRSLTTMLMIHLQNSYKAGSLMK